MLEGSNGVIFADVESSELSSLASCGDLVPEWLLVSLEVLF